MSDDTKVSELLQRYTTEQLARAYLKASRERNEAQRKLVESEKKRIYDGLRNMARTAGVY